jgi:hypothetical protein
LPAEGGVRPGQRSERSPSASASFLRADPADRARAAEGDPWPDPFVDEHCKPALSARSVRTTEATSRRNAMTGGLFAGAAVLFVVAAVASGAWYWWVLAGTFAVLAVITVMSARRDRQS